MIRFFFIFFSFKNMDQQLTSLPYFQKFRKKQTMFDALHLMILPAIKFNPEQ